MCVAIKDTNHNKQKLKKFEKKCKGKMYRAAPARRKSSSRGPSTDEKIGRGPSAEAKLSAWSNRGENCDVFDVSAGGILDARQDFHQRGTSVVKNFALPRHSSIHLFSFSYFQKSLLQENNGR